MIETERHHRLSYLVFAAASLTCAACLEAAGTEGVVATDAGVAGNAPLTGAVPSRNPAPPPPSTPATTPAPALPKRPAGWAEDSHGKIAPPRYEVLFPAGKVLRIDVRIAPADWQRMQDDMTAMLGKFGAGGLALPVKGQGPLTLVPRDPIYVPATIGFEGRTWTNVGLRYRGNATLASNWKRGMAKLPFRLDFDELEKQFPAIDDQRFFGLKAVALISNSGDSSALREKVAGDLYRLAGLPVGRAGFARVFVDHGQGPVYFGLYTLVEIPGKEMLAAAFGDDRGNLYKPDGEGAKFVTFDAATFEKKTNTGSDFSDVQAVFSALQGSRGDPAAWRARLGQVFDTDGFLKWLAVNTTMTNWDTYGMLAHNFYLYGNPKNGGRLSWIPWDHNESMKPGYWPFVYAPSSELREINAGWPLIRHLMDDPVYRATYYQHVRTFVNGPFAKDAVIGRLRADHALISRYVVGPEGERPPFTFLAKPEDFASELSVIVEHVGKRHDQAVRAARANP